MRTGDNVAAGMSPEAARRNARLRFGNPTVMKERVTATDAALGLDNCFRDLKYAIRQVERSRVFALTVIVTLALGIGATTAIFSVMDAVLLRPLPYLNPDRLVYVLGQMHRRNTADLPFSNADYLDLRNGAKTRFQDFSSVRTGFMLLQQKDGTAEQVRSATITPNFFRLLGGRIFC
jgi:putative ABC transport system permease protein